MPQRREKNTSKYTLLMAPCRRKKEGNNLVVSRLSNHLQGLRYHPGLQDTSNIVPILSCKQLLEETDGFCLII